jgi:predicted MFS family arabinose efflux permease
MAGSLTRTPDRTRSAMRTALPGAAMIAVSFGLARYGYGLLLPDMQSELGFTSSAAGVISSCTYLSYLIANIAVVWLTNRLGPRVAIGLAAALATVGMSVIASASSVVVLAIGVLLSGAAAGFAFPPYADIVARQVRSDRRALAWSVISSGTGWGVALGGPVAIVAGGSWRIVWMVFVAFAVVVGITAVALSPKRGEKLRRPQLSVTWFFCPKSRPLLLSAVLIGSGSAVWWAFSVDALRHAGLSSTTARIVYAVCGAASIVASVSGAAFARFGLRAGYLAACVLLGGSLALLGIATGHLLAALSAAILFGVFYCAVIAAQGIWSSQVFADHPSAGLAAINTALTIGTLAGPAIAGAAITTFGFPPTLIGAAVVVVAALPFCPPNARRRGILAAHQCKATPVKP